MKEQAAAFAAQGSLLRAAALYRKLVAIEPTAENLNAYGDVLMRQGLDEDACALYMKAMGRTPVITTKLMNELVNPTPVATGYVN